MSSCGVFTQWFMDQFNFNVICGPQLFASDMYTNNAFIHVMQSIGM